MFRSWIKIVLAGLLFVFFCSLPFFSINPQYAAAQQPTGDIPTVTGTPINVEIVVTYEEQINVRSGPSSRANAYSIVGILFPGQHAPVLGRSPGGDWILIYFPGVSGDSGWVYAPLVSYSKVGFVPIIEPPPTMTPQVTLTINPTLAAAYIIPATPTRVSTFTPPGPLVIPTFEDQAQLSGSKGIPMGLVIFTLAFIGGLGVLAIFLRR
jgi:hypothetical protein